MRKAPRQVQRIASYPKVTVSADGRGVCLHVGSRLMVDVAISAEIAEVFEDAVGGGRRRRRRMCRVGADRSAVIWARA